MIQEYETQKDLRNIGLDMEKVNINLLKDHIDRVSLQNAVRPHFIYVLEQTIDPVQLAITLVEKNVLSTDERNQVTDQKQIFFQNLELYRAAWNKNSGNKLIDALHESGNNFHILQVLLAGCNESEVSPKSMEININEHEEKSNLNHLNFNIPAISKLQISAGPNPSLNAHRISILKSVVKIKDTPSNKWTETIGAQNFSNLEEDNFDWTLARVVTTGGDDGHSRQYFTPEEFDANEPTAILKFLEAQLEHDPKKKVIGRQPLEIYINTRYFTYVEWESLSRFLFDFCWDSLENLWLDDVNFKAYSYGTQWMTNLTKHKHLSFRFEKLKFFIFDGPTCYLYKSILQSILMLIQSTNYPLADFWKDCCCQVQIRYYYECQILMDPIQGILFYHGGQDDFKDEIGNLSCLSLPGDELDKKRVPIVKLYQHLPKVDLFKEEINQRFLNHLFLVGVDNFQLLKDIMNNLTRFKFLEKLGLSVSQTWPIDLKPLDVLDKLSFLYLDGFAVNSGGFGVDLFPWKPSVKTVILSKCSFKLKIPNSELSVTNQDSVILKPFRNQGIEEAGLLCIINKLTVEEAQIVMLREFFNWVVKIRNK